MRKGIRASLMAVVTALVLVITMGMPAQARYIYYPGEYMYVKSGSSSLRCTGAYTVRLNGQLYMLTAGHCGPAGSSVRNRSAALGAVAKTGYRAGANGGFSGFDHSLVKLTQAGATQWQQVLNPLTGRTIYPSGKINGLFNAKGLVQGYKVAKSGTTTGVTSGPIVAYTRWGVDIAYCAQMRTLPGDSGGPVFRTIGSGLYAVGLLVAYAGGGSIGCFISMDEVLRRWGASLPTYTGDKRANPPALALAGASAGSYAAPTPQSVNGLPYLDPSQVKGADLP